MAPPGVLEHKVLEVRRYRHAVLVGCGASCLMRFGGYTPLQKAGWTTTCAVGTSLH